MPGPGLWHQPINSILDVWAPSRQSRPHCGPNSCAAPLRIAAAFAATTRAAVGIIAELNHHHIHVMMVFGPVIADEDNQSSPPSSVQLSLNLFRARGHHRHPWDGTTYVQVLYRFNGRQTSTPLDDQRPDFVAIICNSGSQLCPSREW